MVGRIIFSPEEVRKKQQDDHDAPDQVSEDELQESKISCESQSRRANDGERGGFRGDDRQGQRPPRRGAPA